MAISPAGRKRQRGAANWISRRLAGGKNPHGEDQEWKVHGKDAAGKEAELHVWLAPRGEFTLERFVEASVQEHFKPLANYALKSRGHRSVAGADAITHSITFNVGVAPARMDTMFFADKDHVYCVGLSSIAWSAEEMRDLMDRIAGSIRL